MIGEDTHMEMKMPADRAKTRALELMRRGYH